MSRSKSNNKVAGEASNSNLTDNSSLGIFPPPDKFRRTFSSPELAGIPVPGLPRSTSDATGAFRKSPNLAPTPIDTSSGSVDGMSSSPSWNPLNYLSRGNSKRAHLGDENQFIYDRIKGEWVLSSGGIVVEGKKTEPGDWEVSGVSEAVQKDKVEELLEQHAITLAIQVNTVWPTHALEVLYNNHPPLLP